MERGERGAREPPKNRRRPRLFPLIPRGQAELTSHKTLRGAGAEEEEHERRRGRGKEKESPRWRVTSAQATSGVVDFSGGRTLHCFRLPGPTSPLPAKKARCQNSPSPSCVFFRGTLVVSPPVNPRSTEGGRAGEEKGRRGLRKRSGSSRRLDEEKPELSASRTFSRNITTPTLRRKLFTLDEENGL